MPVAVNCWLAPTAIEKFAGVTVIDAKVGCVTVNSVEPLTVPDVAVIVEDPAATPIANPDVDIVAVDAIADDQTAVAVKSFVLPSL